MGKTTIRLQVDQAVADRRERLGKEKNLTLTGFYEYGARLYENLLTNGENVLTGFQAEQQRPSALTREMQGYTPNPLRQEELEGKRMMVSLPPHLKGAVEHLAERTGKSQNDVVVGMLDFGLHIAGRFPSLGVKEIVPNEVYTALLYAAGGNYSDLPSVVNEVLTDRLVKLENTTSAYEAYLAGRLGKSALTKEE